IAPMGEPAMSFFCQSGTEAVEGALKLARYITRRPRFIGFLVGFYCCTMGSLCFTSNKYTQQLVFGPTMLGVTHVPHSYSYPPPDVLVPALRGRARHHDPSKGSRFGPADRSGRREEVADGAVEARRTRQHLRRQPDRLRGGERDDRPGGRRLHGERGERGRAF